MPEAVEIPNWDFILSELVSSISVRKHLVSHHGEDVDDDAQNDCDVTYRPNTFHDGIQQSAHGFP